ncbi:hypothetical protein [Halomonas garicola]|uniref:hypothetical protein n=1 Tax=Halomonas garicola TaxID=1690008 RepID=UPI002897F4DD|nr:hypothetical protein [Halomonas garicola]
MSEPISEHDETAITPDLHRQRRRRLLAALGTGLAGAYVAPTLFSVGQARAGGSYSRPSYSRPSRPSRYRGPYRRERRRLHEYEDEPVRILEDILLGPPRR